MTVMANLQESFSAEILGENMNGKETGVIALKEGPIKPNNK